MNIRHKDNISFFISQKRADFFKFKYFSKCQDKKLLIKFLERLKGLFYGIFRFFSDQIFVKILTDVHIMKILFYKFIRNQAHICCDGVKIIHRNGVIQICRPSTAFLPVYHRLILELYRL